MKKFLVGLFCVAALVLATTGGVTLAIEDKPSITSIKPGSKFL